MQIRWMLNCWMPIHRMPIRLNGDSQNMDLTNANSLNNDDSPNADSPYAYSRNVDSLNALRSCILLNADSPDAYSRTVDSQNALWSCILYLLLWFLSVIARANIGGSGRPIGTRDDSFFRFDDHCAFFFVTQHLWHWWRISGIGRTLKISVFTRERYKMYEYTIHWWITQTLFEIDRPFSSYCRTFNLLSTDVFGDVIHWT